MLFQWKSKVVHKVVPSHPHLDIFLVESVELGLVLDMHETFAKMDVKQKVGRNVTINEPTSD